MIGTHGSGRLYPVNRPVVAFGAGAAVAVLGGLIGLGGAEFRLPVLITVFALYPHRAVRINLLISFATLAFSAVSRFGFTGAASVASYMHVILAMIAGGMISAWLGAGYLSRIPKGRVSLVIAVPLLVIAALLALEAVVAIRPSIRLPALAEFPIAVAIGFVVGGISSLLGVAGGEFIIPTLLFIFGADIKTAGTASVLISTPLVLTGVARHILGGKYRSQTMLARLAIPMSAGSIAGAILGGYAALWAPGDSLKAMLAAVLAASSMKLLRWH